MFVPWSGYPMMKLDAGLDQEPDVAGGDRRVGVPLGVA